MGMTLDIKKVTDPEVGPIDGVELDTQGVYTKFRGNDQFKRIFKTEPTKINMKASLSNGTVSITDRNRNQMVSVSITELAAFLNEALRKGAEVHDGAIRQV